MRNRAWPILAGLLAFALLAGVFLIGIPWILPGYDMGVEGESLRMCCWEPTARLLKGRPDSSERNSVTGMTTLSYSTVRIFGIEADAEYDFLEGRMIAARYRMDASQMDEVRYLQICNAFVDSGQYSEWTIGAGSRPAKQVSCFESWRDRGAGTGFQTRVEFGSTGMQIDVQGHY